MESTTDLNVIRKKPRAFTWGRIIKIHDIGDYTFVEHEDKHSGSLHFHIYVNGFSTHTSETSIEGALIFAIAYKHLEQNEARWMTMGVKKLLGVKVAP